MKGQVNQVFIILIGVIFIGAIVLFATSTVTDITKQNCQIDAERFKSDFNMIKTQMASSRGEAQVKQFQIPCNVDRILFFDNNKEVLFAGFEGLPIVMDALHSDTTENVFLLDGNDVVQTFYIPNIQVKVPYFTCTMIEGNNIELMFKTDNNGETHLQAIGQSDCTFDYVSPIELSYDDAAAILNDIFKENKSIMNYSIVDPIAAGLKRKVTLEDNETVINITKEYGTFDYYESIPKCAMESFMDFESRGLIELTGDYKNITDDPLIMWNFDDSGEESITYTLNRSITAECLRGNSPGLFGLAVADDPYSGIPNDKKDSAKAMRTEANLPNLTYIKSKARDRIIKQVDEEKRILSEDLNLLSQKIRNNNTLENNEKLSLMREVDSLAASIENPVYAEEKAKSLKSKLEQKGISFQDIQNNSLIKKLNHTFERDYVVGRDSFESYGVDTTCKDDPGWCYDGYNTTDQCHNSTHISEVTCGSDGCQYETQSCGSDVCRDGRCVTPSTCIDSDGGINETVAGSCEDSDNTYFDTCTSDYQLKEYDCSSDQCTSTIIDIVSGFECKDGKKVPVSPECRIEYHDDVIQCYEGDDLKNTSSCKQEQTSIYSRNVGCFYGHCGKQDWEYVGFVADHKCNGDRAVEKRGNDDDDDDERRLD
ncbi:MAG: hypothetical protein ACLFP2_04910 [Candidatus Woesearchaeota archaeon]